MATQVRSIKTNNADPIYNIPVAVASTAKVREIFTAGDLVGVLKSDPQTFNSTPGVYSATLGLLVEVGADGIAGTAALGAKVYVTTANVITLTPGTNRQCGITTRAKLATGDTIWFLLLPSLGLAAAS